VDVVAVNSASTNATLCPLFELMGSQSSSVPTATTQRKLSMIRCVVDSENRFLDFIDILFVGVDIIFIVSQKCGLVKK
jgi:hypothetical protein